MPPPSAEHGTLQDSQSAIDTESTHTDMAALAQSGVGDPVKTEAEAEAHQDDIDKGLGALHIEPTAADTPSAISTKEVPLGPPHSETETEKQPEPVPEAVPEPELPLSEKPYNDPTLDTTLNTPDLSREPSHRSKTHADGAEKGGPAGENTEAEVESRSEIQSIMDQFADESAAPTREEIMTPRHELSSPMLASAHPFPPRQSSLEPLRSRDMDSIAPASPPPVPPKPESAPSSTVQEASTSLPHQPHPQPPDPEPEPDLPFDFHRFLEQLRHKSADPVAKFLRSFLTEFGKKQWMVHEQVKIIGDFLTFISNKMALCEVWREVSENEFDNAKEGMEKLVMNRLYPQTFSPAIPPPVQLPRSRSKGRRKDGDGTLGPGRRGQHQEDVERDEVLSQKIRIYHWVREEHLDIPPVGANGERFLRLAQQELLKINSYRAPRDKVICVLNCCKVIFGLLKNAKKSDTSADSFVPLLIYVVLQANPDHLVSNIQYILRFRNQDKLGGEAGYYLSSLSGAIQFIEGLDRTSLTVSDEDFERNVEAAVSEIAAQDRGQEATATMTTKEAAAPPAGRRSTELTSGSSPRRSRTRDSRTTSGLTPSTNSEDSDAVGGLLRTIQKPLNTIGRIFSDPDQSNSSSTSNDGSLSTATATAPVPPPLPQRQQQQQHSQLLQHQHQPLTPHQAHQVQQEQGAAEARRIQRAAEHNTVVDTLCGMFPNLDKEVIDDVVRQKQGKVGLAVDACLALTAGS